MKNAEYTDLFQTVADNFLDCEGKLVKIKTAIERTDLLKPASKKALLQRVSNIFAEANEIVKKMGQLGKVK